MNEDAARHATGRLLANRTRRLAPPCAERVLDADDSSEIGRIDLLQIAIENGPGKRQLDLPRFIARMTADGFTGFGLEDAPLTGQVRLPQQDDHRARFDRLRLAQCSAEPMILLSTDGKLARYGPTLRVL